MFKIIEYLNNDKYPQYLLKAWEHVAILYEQDIDTLRQQQCHWLVADHPKYGVIGGISLRPGFVSNTSSLIIEERAPAIGKGWVGHYLYFHSEDECMDAMDDQEFRLFMHTFYYELHQTIQTVCLANHVPYVCTFSNPDQYTGAVVMGSLPFENAVPLRTGKDDVMLAFLPIQTPVQKLSMATRCIPSLQIH